MADETKEQAGAGATKAAADVLKDRLDYIKQRNLMDVVEEQRQRDKNAERSARIPNERNPRGGIR